MKTRTLLSILTLTLMLNTMGQEPGIEITFSAIDNVSWIQLDSIKVINRTQGVDTTLFYPDTLLILDYQTRISKITGRGGNLHVFQNYPNPMVDQTTLSLYIPEKDEIRLIITDIMGRVLLKTDRILDKGIHKFRFASAGEHLYFFTALWREQSSRVFISSSAS